MKSFNAICTHIVAVGTKEDTELNCHPEDAGPRIAIGWRVFNDDNRGSKEKSTFFKLYKLSIQVDSELRSDVISWLGVDEDFKRFNIRKLLGKDCQLELFDTIKGTSESTFSVKRVVSGLQFESKKISASELIYFTAGDPEHQLLMHLPFEVQLMIENSMEHKVSTGSILSKDDEL
jgi:hypothetical protein